MITAVGKFKTYILFSIFALLAAANTSCIEEVNIYQDPLWGSWILTYDDYGPVDPYYAEIFYFGSDGYGTLNWVDEWGREYGISGFSRLVERGFQEYSLTLYHGTY